MTNLENIQNFLHKRLKVSSGSEEFLDVFSNQHFQIELIYSNQALSEVMQQNFVEVIFLVNGWAILKMEEKEIKLETGAYLTINKNIRHQVIATSNDAIWIAIKEKEGNYAKS